MHCRGGIRRAGTIAACLLVELGMVAGAAVAIDRFASKPVKAGTCTTVRVVPEQYTSEDVIGFMKGSKRVDVTVELTSRVAASATCRRWQTEQRTEKLADGRAQMTFAVSDIDEVVRWSLGFGADARIIAPPEAVGRASAIAGEIAQAYRNATNG